VNNSRAPLRPSETSYLLFQQIMQGAQPALAGAPPKKKTARTANKVAPKKAAKKVAKKVK
jgi:hypothetical protein